MKTKVHSYLRCSSLSSVDSDSFDRQRAAIQMFCKMNNAEVEKEFIDAGVSGTLTERPALKDLIVALRSNGVKTVVVSDHTRIARSLIAQETILNDFRSHGFKVVDATGNDLTAEDKDPTKILIRQVLGAVAEWNRNELTAKLAAAKQRIKKANPQAKTDGRYGYTGEIVKRAKFLRRKRSGKHLSFARIADKLNEEGFKPQSGKKFYASTVKNMVES
jgi:DNA invertase Pin-like site-specific DNA recombinase